MGMVVKSVNNCIFNNHKNRANSKDVNLVTVGKTRAHCCRRNLITLIMNTTIININMHWEADDREREREKEREREREREIRKLG